MAKRSPTPSLGFFELDTSSALFDKATSDHKAFLARPSGDRLFNLVCVLNHLREWIHAEANPAAVTFAETVSADSDYKIVKDLCNCGKHPEDRKGIRARTRTSVGATCTSRCNDSLGQRYFWHDGQDIRDILYRLVTKYRSYFAPDEEPPPAPQGRAT